MKKFPPKAESVAKWEGEHPEFFIGLGPECAEDCRCKMCFHIALDRLVSKSEATANACGIGAGEHDDLASYLVSQCPATDRFDTIQHFDGR